MAATITVTTQDNGVQITNVSRANEERTVDGIPQSVITETTVLELVPPNSQRTIAIGQKQTISFNENSPADGL